LLRAYIDMDKGRRNGTDESKKGNTVQDAKRSERTAGRVVSHKSEYVKKGARDIWSKIRLREDQETGTETEIIREVRGGVALC